MGQSTDAILFYGLVGYEEEEWWDEFVAPWDDEENEYEGEWSTYCLERLGKMPIGPSETYPEDAKRDGRGGYIYTEGQQAIVDQYCKHWDVVRKLKEKHVESMGVMIGRHCSGEYSMPYVAIAESELSAGRGEPEGVPGEFLDQAQERMGEVSHDDRLRKFCEVMGIPWPTDDEKNGPGWYLVSMWM